MKSHKQDDFAWQAGFGRLLTIGIVVGVSDLQLVKLDSIPLLHHTKDCKKWYSQISCLMFNNGTKVEGEILD